MTQNDSILAHLQDKGHITPLEALDLYGSFRLAARISDLRDAGYDITTEYEETPLGKRYARYVLERKPVQVGMGL